MTAVPSPPAGAVAQRPVRLGEIAVWQHTSQPPYLAVHLFAPAAGPPAASVATGPAELRAMAWLLLAGARWLDDARAAAGLTPPAVADPQLSLLDPPAAIGAGTTT